MPCSRCTSDTTKYPKTLEWGPLIWNILHTLADKSGKQANNILQADEQRTWPLVIKHLPAILPCEECRAHATQYIKDFPFQPPESYPAWNLYIRTYFYTFHESVNTRLGKPSFPFSALAETYKDPGPLQQWLKELEEMMLRAMKLNGMQIKTWQTWRNHVRMLKAAMGL
jgi:hypothetical protein